MKIKRNIERLNHKIKKKNKYKSSSNWLASGPQNF